MWSGRLITHAKIWKYWRKLSSNSHTRWSLKSKNKNFFYIIYIIKGQGKSTTMKSLTPLRSLNYRNLILKKKKNLLWKLHYIYYSTNEYIYIYIYIWGILFQISHPPAHFIFWKKNIYQSAKFSSSFLVFDAIWPFPKSINHNLEFSLLSRSLPEKTVFFFFYISCLKK